jgi:hypothetical protein
MLGRLMFLAVPLAPIWLVALMLVTVHWGGQEVQVLESYGQKELEDPHHPAVCGVLVDGVQTHTKGGCNPHWTKADYTEIARANTPEDYNRLIGCPELQDGIEAVDLAARFPLEGTGLRTKGLA